MARSCGRRYPVHMVIDAPHRKALASVIAQVLTPAQLVRARELSGSEPQPRELLHWMRDYMPVAAQQVEDILYPAD
jgi:hypothetical protein